MGNVSKAWVGLAMAVVALTATPGYADAYAVCAVIKGTLAAKLNDACASTADLTKDDLENFRDGIDILEKECGENDFTDGLTRGLYFKKNNMIETCKARAKMVSHAAGLTES